MANACQALTTTQNTLATPLQHASDYLEYHSNYLLPAHDTLATTRTTQNTLASTE